MKNNTKIRLHLSKNLFESLAKQVVAESKKGDMSGGAYTEAVKQPKAPKAHKEKAPKAEKEGGVKEMETRVAEEGQLNENEAAAVQDLMQFLQDNAGFLAGMGGIVGAAKWIASKVAKDPEARKALDKATGAGSEDLGPFGGKSFGKK